MEDVLILQYFRKEDETSTFVTECKKFKLHFLILCLFSA